MKATHMTRREVHLEWALITILTGLLVMALATQLAGS